MEFDFQYTAKKISLGPRTETQGLVARFLAPQSAPDLEALPASELPVACAIEELRAMEDDFPEEITVTGEDLTLSHRVAASLRSETASALGLPPMVDLVLRTDVEGVVGNHNFRLRYGWYRNGQRETPSRVGAILETARGPRLLPRWMMDAIDVAEAFEDGEAEDRHWEALARFRQALDPGVRVTSESHAARVSTTDFLSGLSVQLADSFALSPRGAEGALDFDVVPFSGRSLAEANISIDDVLEENAEITGDDLSVFQQRFQERGALPAYRLRQGSYIVVDNSAEPVLRVMAEKKRASVEERDAFVRNPRLAISDAIERHLEERGEFEGLSDAQREEVLEKASVSSLIETREYSDRVTGIARWQAPQLDLGGDGGTTWMPEVFGAEIARKLDDMSQGQIREVREQVHQAIESGEPEVAVEGIVIPATPASLSALDAEIRKRDLESEPTNDEPSLEPNDDDSSGPIVIETQDNFDSLSWLPPKAHRLTTQPGDIPATIQTKLKSHQVSSLSWQISAWTAGLPGILNADEQGLGKTLQTIAFLVWLKAHMASDTAEHRGPVLIVAPTSLLENWEEEVERHVAQPGLGNLIRLYGSAVGALKIRTSRGKDTDRGEETLDFGALHEAINEGRAHRNWILTTYTTLTNYQHSLGRIPFSCVVFDEIQAIKNPASLRAAAARAMNADFRIGLTGTPIENSTVDLWAIMDQLAPGALGSLREFRKQFALPDETNMKSLHDRVFTGQNGRPALALRRLKDDVAKDLPEKSRKLHPRPMPPVQADAYEGARSKLAESGKGGALKMLHHIRSVSVHPNAESNTPPEQFVSESARLEACFDILRKVADVGERALVFIEHRQIQARFAALAKQEFGLKRIDTINGSTPVKKRQEIVNRFQRHLSNDGGFDLLVLGPKAAGTGLTLTAATHVVHLSRWWNPAVEEQCNDRVHRIGQTRPVTVHIPMSIHPEYREHSFDCLLHSLMQGKRKLAQSALWPMGDTDSDAARLQEMLSSDSRQSGGDVVEVAMASMFDRDEAHLPARARDGSYEFS